MSDDEESGSNLPPEPKKRLAPKLGLQGMVVFIMDLRLRGRMIDGTDGKETWALLTPEDLEKLEDVADTLEWLRLQRLAEKQNARGRGR